VKNEKSNSGKAQGGSLFFFIKAYKIKIRKCASRARENERKCNHEIRFQSGLPQLEITKHGLANFIGRFVT
jgi:hypothetical protein